LPMQRNIALSDISAAWATRGYIRRFGPFDIIHGHSSKGGAIARLAAIGSGTPTIYTPHAMVTMAPDLSALKRRLFGLAELILSKLSTFIIAVGPAEERFAVASGLGRARVVMVPNGIGPMDLPSREQARRACGVGDDAIVIGWVGRLIENKAPDMLIKAVALAARSAPRLRAVLVGDGPMQETLRGVAQSMGIADKVTLLGEFDARQVLPAFDVFAISSRMEGMPYVALEAMAAGLPIISTVTGGVELLVEPGVNGAIIPTDACDALVHEIVKLVTDDALRARMGEASRQRVGQFSQERMVERTLAVYERCAAQIQGDEEPQLAGHVE
jgi:glycosyltransferase involved in cell wall biosynthesis